MDDCRQTLADWQKRLVHFGQGDLTATDPVRVLDRVKAKDVLVLHGWLSLSNMLSLCCY